jgi:CDP-2,3-bis-(O-geranylgeranyl)-sn-glycerol synthase
LFKSFFKRRFGKERGTKWPVADQYDLVAGAFLLLLLLDPTWLSAYVTIPVLIIILIITPVLHRAVNIIGYHIRVKEVPW